MIFKTKHRIAAFIMVVAVCLSSLAPSAVMGQDAKPKNVFDASATLPDTIKRVTVLPLACEESRTDLSDGCETLDPVLQTELSKTKRFEVVSIGPEQLRNSTGRAAWTGTENLPSNFFDSLNQAQGCDAVLFCQLTSYKAYVPINIGWRLKLVDARTQKVLWVVDEVFDASDPAVAKSAQQFQKAQQDVDGKSKTLAKRTWGLLNRETPSDLDDQWDILNSPRYFGQFAAVTSLESLPKR
jgi:hypothetical protein